MPLRIVTADQRLAEANGKTTVALFGPSGVGKTSQLLTLPAEDTLCVDLEAGLKSVQGWPGELISIRSFADAIDIACLIGGVDPAAPADGFFSEAHHRYLTRDLPGPRRPCRRQADRLRRQHHRSDAPGDGLGEDAAGGLF